jgi:hypothetical protein
LNSPITLPTLLCILDFFIITIPSGYSHQIPYGVAKNNRIILRLAKHQVAVVAQQTSNNTCCVAVIHHAAAVPLVIAYI